MARGSIFEVLQYFCFKYTNISGELMLCINVLLVVLFFGKGHITESDFSANVRHANG